MVRERVASILVVNWILHNIHSTLQNHPSTFDRSEKMGRFRWMDEAEQAFDRLKQAVTPALMLQMPKFLLLFTIETDASNIGIGVTLSQSGHPIAYYSRAMGI